MVAINETYQAVDGCGADFTATTSGTQPMVNNLYQGMTLDSVTGLYYERNRNYSPSLGHWMEQDPAQYINGANTYQFVMSNPVRNVDASGEAVGIPIPNPVLPNGGTINPNGQPAFLPPLPNGNKWVPVRNPQFPNNSDRPVKWSPQTPIPNPENNGSQPQGSWDPTDGYGVLVQRKQEK